MLLDLSVIILTYNEEKHIRRCIENVKSVAKEIFIVDSFSTDKTIAIAEKLGAKIYQNKWENNYAKQFNWALENISIETEWILRLDADEYLTQDLVKELETKLDILDCKVNGLIFKRRHIFFDKWIKRGTYPVKLLRMFKKGKAVCEQRLMDEHIQILEGETMEFDYDFVDHNLNDISWWTTKHVNYAIREAADLLNIEFDLFAQKNANLGKQANEKRTRKVSYAKKPLFLRSFLYFIYRYFFKLGFLEGKEGFLWHFLQGWWYRTLVDAKIYEIKKACGNDKDRIIDYIALNYKIDLRNQQ